MTGLPVGSLTAGAKKRQVRVLMRSVFSAKPHVPCQKARISYLQLSAGHQSMSNRSTCSWISLAKFEDSPPFLNDDPEDSLITVFEKLRALQADFAHESAIRVSLCHASRQWQGRAVNLSKPSFLLPIWVPACYK